ncbi:Mbeg1-like protein [Arthrobacter sp.]|uniref:Mbeg1-like protein n=1 Tax=Arthrobacter sp. TaxID=1667 RepID=UPI002810A995|nr:Mbeg1-like protein [Arthrobacter sp.]
MPSLLDYVHWRGDITLGERPFKVVDNLVLTALSNIDLAGIVPEAGTGESILVRDAAAALSERPSSGVGDRRLVFVPVALLEAMGASARFGNAALSAYVDETDHVTGMQFAAVTIHLDDGHTYVSYRGTDSTITGWREDFTMSFDLVPAQPWAAEYLGHRLAETTGSLIVGGHSKGGNLAVYAAMKQDAPAQERIVAVYNSDGPGLGPGIADDVALARISGRIVRIVPEFAVIGRIFDGDVSTHIVASSARGLMQHDIMTWQVEGVRLEERSAQSRRAAILNRAVDIWIEGAAPADRRDFTDAVFGALSAGGAVLLQDIPSKGSGSFESVIFSFVRSRTKTRRSLRIGAGALVQAFTAADFSGLLQQKAILRGVMLTVIGLYFIAVPSLGVQVLGGLAAFVICVYLAGRLRRYFARYYREHRLRWQVLILPALFLVLLVWGAQLHAFTIPRNLLLSAALVVYAWSTGRRALTMFYQSPRRGVIGGSLAVSAVVSLLFAIVMLSTVDRVMPFYVLQLGQYLLIAGICTLFLFVRDRVAAEYSDAALERSVAR